MQELTAITPKWQVYIPKGIRQRLNLVKPQKAKIKVEEKKIIIEPIESPILKLGGTLRSYYRKRKVNLAKVRDQIDYSNL